MKSFKFVFLFCLVLFGFGVKAQFYARVSGAWNNPATWSSTQGGPAGTTTPSSSDDVYTEGFSISIPSGSFDCNSLYVAYNTANGITFGLGSQTLNIYGELASYDPSTLNYATPTVAVIKNNASNLEINLIGSTFTEAINSLGWGANAPLRRVSFSPGVGNTVGIHDLVISAGGILTVKNGTLDILGNLQSANTTSGSITVNLGGTLLVSSGSISGPGGNSNSFPTINNNGIITSSANSTSYINASTVNLNANSFFNVGFNGANQTEGWWYQSTSPSSVVADPTSTVNYNASVVQNIFAQGYGNLTIGGAGTITKTVSGTGSLNLDGNLSFSNTGITLLVPSANQTVFDGTGSQQISGGGTVNFNGGLQVNKASGTLTVGQDINWQGIFNLNQGTLVFTNASTATATGIASITGAFSPSFYNLAVSGTGNLTSTSGNVNIAGNFTNNGTFNANNGTLTFNGSAAQTIAGSTNTNFSNITSTNSLSLTVSSAQSITDALTLSAGVFNANGNVTLISTSFRDARIAQITGGATISGAMTVQRYLPNTAGVRDYRYLASPVTNATVSQWKAAFPITGTFSDPSTQAEWNFTPAVISGTPSMYLYNEAHTPTSTVADRYEAFPSSGSSSSNTLVNGQGYAAFVRQTSPLNVISVTGTPKIGPAGVSVTAQSAGGNDGWNLIGNPFASPISWANVTIPSGVNAQIALLDNTNNVGQGVGVYAYYTQGGAGIPASYQGTIASGQAFFVRATSNATIIFQEDDKVTTANPSFIRQGTLADLLRVNLTGNGKMDELVIHFKEGASDAADNQFDAFKLANTTINFSSFSSDGKKMAINTMSTLGCTKEVGLVVEGVTAGTHRLNFSDFESFTAGIEIKLLDSFTGTTHTVTTEAPNYDFDVTTDAASYGANRFKVQFAYPTVLANLKVMGENVCVGTDSQITVSGSQTGVNYYAAINGSAVSDVVPGSGNQLNIKIPHAKLTKGDNQIVIMAGRAGCANTALSQTAVVKTDNIYTVAAATSAPVCKEGEVTITASGAPVDGSYRWYESSEAANAIAGQTSAVFKTASLNKTKTYYVSVVNSLGCEGARKEASARVVSFDAAAITQTSYATLQSNFETGNQWYLNDQPITGATAKVLEVKESGVYKLKVAVEGACETSANLTMVITDVKSQLESRQVYPNPVKDILTIKLPSEKGVAVGLIQNELGQKIGQITFKSTDDFLIGEFNFEEKMPGLYIVRITQGNSITNHKIVKK